MFRLGQEKARSLVAWENAPEWQRDIYLADARFVLDALDASGGST